MGKIYIDVTNIAKVPFISGIQRVVRNVIFAFEKIIPQQYILLVYDKQKKSFFIIDKAAFIASLHGERNDVSSMYTRPIQVSEMKPHDIFFDLDSTWYGTAFRPNLFKKLRKYGVQIVVYIYDLIPLTNPEHCDQHNVFNYIPYLGATLKYANAVITSTQSTLDELEKLEKKFNLRHIPGYVSWLGSDLVDNSIVDKTRVPKTVLEATEKKYILCVGTIEPRKNHQFVLDAFDKGLFAEDLNLIFAGRIGWDIAELLRRIDSHPKLGRQFFHFVDLDDTAISYLYQNAYAVAFPTFNEGFGLPVVEALQYGTPVLTSDIPVMREVGRDYCMYFDHKNPYSFIDLVRSLLAEPEKYSWLKQKANSFVPFTWEETAKKILDALSDIIPTSRAPLTDVKQMVILSARKDDLLRSLPFVEAFIPFIEEIVVCCPDKMKEQLPENLGRLKITAITDSELLVGDSLPEDHSVRNFFLRCRIMRSEKIDPVFIMADDDARPLRKLDKSVFVSETQYNAYYFYDLDSWEGALPPTSFDNCLFRTRDFLHSLDYSSLAFASHMPQIIDKSIYCEMLDANVGMEMRGVCEWSTYFNYVISNYPTLIDVKPYVTLSWPAFGTDWSRKVEQTEYLFENFCDFLYEENKLFSGFSTEYYPDIEAENGKKIQLYSAEMKKFKAFEKGFENYLTKYENNTRMKPAFVIDFTEDIPQIYVPKSISFRNVWFIRIPFTCIGKHQEFEVQTKLYNRRGRLLNQIYFSVRNNKKFFLCPVWTLHNKFIKYSKLEIVVRHDSKQSSPATIVFKSK